MCLYAFANCLGMCWDCLLTLILGCYGMHSLLDRLVNLVVCVLGMVRLLMNCLSVLGMVSCFCDRLLRCLVFARLIAWVFAASNWVCFVVCCYVFHCLVDFYLLLVDSDLVVLLTICLLF